jgi:hypothetical protein
MQLWPVKGVTEWKRLYIIRQYTYGFSISAWTKHVDSLARTVWQLLTIFGYQMMADVRNWPVGSPQKVNGVIIRSFTYDIIFIIALVCL